MEKISKKHKIMFICLFFVVCGLMLTGVIQTFVLKSKQNTLTNLESNNSELKSQLSQTKDESFYKVKVDENGNYVCVMYEKNADGELPPDTKGSIYIVSQEELNSYWSIKQTPNGNYYYREFINNGEPVYQELYFIASDQYNSDYTKHEGSTPDGKSFGKYGDIIIIIE